MNCTKPHNAAIRAYLLHRVQAKANLPNGADLAQFDYIDAGLVDSMAIIKFVMDIEEEFDIVITEHDMTCDAFRTIDGLSSLIAEKCK
jgi:acyl carrier protein